MIRHLFQMIPNIMLNIIDVVKKHTGAIMRKIKEIWKKRCDKRKEVKQFKHDNDFMNLLFDNKKLGYDQTPVVRDRMVTALLSDLIQHNRSKSKQRWVFLWSVVGVFVFVVTAGMVVMLIAVSKKQAAITDIVALVGALVGVVSAIISLPNIIANHLFPADSEKNVFDYLTKLHEKDLQHLYEDDNTDEETFDS